MKFMKVQTDVERIIFHGIVLLASLGILIFCFSQGISGNDFWWHVKAGEYICKNHVVPTEDIFSWVRFEMEIPWVAHEWMSEVILYLLYQFLGAMGVFWISLGAAGLMLFLLWKQARPYLLGNIAISLAYFCFFSIAAVSFFYGRPHIFSFFLLFFELKFLYSFYEKDGGKSIWFIPLIAVLWSNLHGGSSNLTYLICIMFLFAGMVPISFGRLESKRLSKKSLMKLGVVTLCTMGGIFVNPIGVQVFLFPYINIGDKLSMIYVAEWHAPDVKDLSQLLLYFFPILLVSMGLLIGKQKIRCIDLLLMLFYVYLFMRSVRFILPWFIVADFYAFRYFPEWKVAKIKAKSEKIAAAVFMGMLGVFCLVGLVKMAKTVQGGNVVKQVMTQEAIEAIQKDNPQRLYNDYNFGEALIHAEIPVFFDSRADMYAKTDIFADGLSLCMLKGITKEGDSVKLDVEELIKKYNFDAFVILKARPLYVYLTSHPEKYQLAYEDEELGYFRRLE